MDGWAGRWAAGGQAGGQACGQNSRWRAGCVSMGRCSPYVKQDLAYVRQPGMPLPHPRLLLLLQPPLKPGSPDLAPPGRPVCYSPICYSPVRYSPVHYSPVRYSPVCYSPIRYSPIHYSPVRYNLQPCTLQPGTLQPCTLQPCMLQPGTWCPQEAGGDRPVAVADTDCVFTLLVQVPRHQGVEQIRDEAGLWGERGRGGGEG